MKYFIAICVLMIARIDCQNSEIVGCVTRFLAEYPNATSECIGVDEEDLAAVCHDDPCRRSLVPLVEECTFGVDVGEFIFTTQYQEWELGMGMGTKMRFIMYSTFFENLSDL